MKKAISLILCLCICLCCCSCSSIYTNYKEIEQLQVIQTMGLDYLSGGISLSLATAFDPKALNGPARLFSDAPTITTAFERIRKYSFEEELFFAHINSLLLGEEAARQGLDSYLMYICRSPDIRIDIPVFVVKGGSAREAVLNVGNTINGISEVMRSVKQTLEWRGDGGVTRTADVVHDLRRHGSALVCALEYSAASEISGSITDGDGALSPSDTNPEQSLASTDRTLAYVGYAIIRDGRLCEYIDREQAIGVAFLKNQVRICDVIVQDRQGNNVTLEIDKGSSDIRPEWSEDGSLSGFQVDTKVEASIVELSNGNLNGGESLEYVQLALEKAVSQYISQVLMLSRKYRSDFLGLGSKIEMKDAEKYRALTTDFDQLLPELEIRINVSGHLRHTNDIKDEDA